MYASEINTKGIFTTKYFGYCDDKRQIIADYGGKNLLDVLKENIVNDQNEFVFSLLRIFYGLIAYFNYRLFNKNFFKKIKVENFDIKRSYPILI